MRKRRRKPCASAHGRFFQQRDVRYGDAASWGRLGFWIDKVGTCSSDFNPDFINSQRGLKDFKDLKARSSRSRKACIPQSDPNMMALSVNLLEEFIALSETRFKLFRCVVCMAWPCMAYPIS